MEGGIRINTLSTPATPHNQRTAQPVVPFFCVQLLFFWFFASTRFTPDNPKVCFFCPYTLYQPLWLCS